MFSGNTLPAGNSQGDGMFVKPAGIVTPPTIPKVYVLIGEIWGCQFPKFRGHESIHTK